MYRYISGVLNPYVYAPFIIYVSVAYCINTLIADEWRNSKQNPLYHSEEEYSNIGCLKRANFIN